MTAPVAMVRLRSKSGEHVGSRTQVGGGDAFIGRDLFMETLVLRNARLPGGDQCDVVCSDGVVASIGPASQRDDLEDIDLDGRLLIPALGEPHAHLDKAYTADLFPNPGGDLLGAVEAILAGWPHVRVEDIAIRAERAVRSLVAAGTTAIRSHLDVTVENQEKSVVALIQVKERVAHLCNLELVALTMPVTGVDGPIGRRMLTRAMEAGIDLVGACPHLEDDPAAAMDIALACGQEWGRPIDLHFDEVLDSTVQHLPELARQVTARGLEGRVTASHCVSHGLLPPDRQREIGRLLATAGVAVVSNPRTNLFLQARGVEAAQPRGLAGIRALLEAGVLVAAGADNVQDPFYVIGRCDPLETASLLVSAAHLSIQEAWSLVSESVRRLLDLTPVEVAVGSPADFVAIRADSVREAIADQPPDRMVFHEGRLIAKTSVTTWTA